MTMWGMLESVASSYWDVVLGDFRWYRRRRGGHWESWQIDPDLYGDSMRGTTGWRRVLRCGVRPETAIGSPDCEDYPSQ